MELDKYLKWISVIGENIYNITQLFPGTGVIDINVESWDAVGNGTLSTTSLTYEEVLSSTGKIIYSPSGSLNMKFNGNDIENDASLLIKEKDFILNQNSRLGFHRVSPIYEISSVNMNIIDDVEVEIQIPKSYDALEHWKFKIFRISDGLILNDITTWSKTGLVVAELSELGELALYYDSEAEFDFLYYNYFFYYMILPLFLLLFLHSAQHLDLHQKPFHTFQLRKI